MLDEILPYAGAWVAQRRLVEEIRPMIETGELPPDRERYVEIDLGTLERLHASEKDRKKGIEEKAKANLVAVTVSFALLSSVIGLLREGNSFIKHGALGITLTIFLAVGLISLLLGGLAALRALRVDQMCDLYIQTEYRLLGAPETERKRELVLAISINERITNIRSNFVDASYTHIRNGILIMACFGLFLIFH